MESYTEIGTIKNGKKKYEVKEIEWEIDNIFSDLLNNTSPFRQSPTFLVANTSWFLRVEPCYRSSVFCRRLHLEAERSRNYSVEYSFSTRKRDGSIDRFHSGTVKETEFAGVRCELNLEELDRQRPEFGPPYSLSIKCTLTYEVTNIYCPPSPLEKNALKLISLHKLSEDFKGLFGIQETCDTTLKLTNKEHKVHRAVLIARSPVFAAMFLHDTSERQTGVINIPDCDPDSFPLFLEYLYCGDIKEMSWHAALHLYVTSDKYEVLELKAFCIQCLTRSLTVENICDIVVFANKYTETELLSEVQEFFNGNVRRIVESSQWELLLKTDYLLANTLMKEMSKVKL